MLNGERKHGLCPGVTEKKDAELFESGVKFHLAQQQSGMIPREEKNVPLYKLKDLYERYSKTNKKSYKSDVYALKIVVGYFGANTVVQTITPTKIEEFKEEGCKLFD